MGRCRMGEGVKMVDGGNGEILGGEREGRWKIGREHRWIVGGWKGKFQSADK